jgi:hypothetical protein
MGWDWPKHGRCQRMCQVPYITGAMADFETGPGCRSQCPSRSRVRGSATDVLRTRVGHCFPRTTPARDEDLPTRYPVLSCAGLGTGGCPEDRLVVGDPIGDLAWMRLDDFASGHATKAGCDKGVEKCGEEVARVATSDVPTLPTQSHRVDPSSQQPFLIRSISLSREDGSVNSSGVIEQSCRLLRLQLCSWVVV